MLAIAPSVLAADFAKLGDQVREVDTAGADRIHIDVMDGHFVPNLSMGSVVVKGLRPVTSKPLEVHLMVEDPSRFIEGFIKAGADTLIVHHEVLEDAMAVIREVRAYNKKVGLAINPGTPVKVLDPYLGEIDVALCMTVWPGFGGQAFIRDSLKRIKELRSMITAHGGRCDLEVDGGIDLNTAKECAEAGANVFVAGTAIFGASGGAAQALKAMAALG